MEASRSDDTGARVAHGWPRDAPPDPGFRGPQVCSVVGITYRQLDYWARTGLLRPSIADATGSGSQRRYSYSDVLELKVIKRLLDAGLKLQQARQAVESSGVTSGSTWPPPTGAGRHPVGPGPVRRREWSTCWPAVRALQHLPLSGRGVRARRRHRGDPGGETGAPRCRAPPGCRLPGP